MASQNIKSGYSVSRIEQTGRFCISWSAVVDLLVLSPTLERPPRDNPIELLFLQCGLPVDHDRNRRGPAGGTGVDEESLTVRSQIPAMVLQDRATAKNGRLKQD